MPTVSIKNDASQADLVAAIKSGLGSDYNVEQKSSGKEVITVRRGTMSTAHVKLERSSGGMKAHVHGGGFIISRLVNELGIANKVTQAIRSSGLSE